MLAFFRNNSKKIVVIIIGAFVMTTMLGVIYYNQSFDGGKKSNHNIDLSDQSVAKIGNDMFVSKQLYMLEIQRLQSMLPKDEPITNNLMNQIQLMGL